MRDGSWAAEVETRSGATCVGGAAATPACWHGWRAATLSVHVAYLPSRRRPRRLSLFLEALETSFAEIPGISPPGPDS